MLRDYEILYIVRPEFDDDQVHDAVGSVDKLIANLGGATVKTDIWGRRRLAYEVRHLREGQYVLTDFRIDPARVPEMEATLKISDSVFRHLIVRKPEKSKKSKKSEAPAAPAAPATADAAAEAIATTDGESAAEAIATTDGESAEEEPEAAPATAVDEVEDVDEAVEAVEAEEAEEGKEE